MRQSCHGGVLRRDHGAARSGACIAAMLCGLQFDIWRSPIGTIPATCTVSNDIYPNLALHLELMPMAHIGMALAAFSCIIWDRRQRPLPVVALPLLFLWRCTSMMIIELATLLLLPPESTPVHMMLAMAPIMLAVGFLSSTAGSLMAKRRALELRYSPIEAFTIVPVATNFDKVVFALPRSRESTRL